MTGRVQGIFRTRKLFSRVLGQVYAIIHFVKTHRMSNTKCEPEVDYGLNVLMMYKCWFTSINCTILRWDADGGEALCMCQEGI